MIALLSRLLARAWVRDLCLGAALLCAAFGLVLFPAECLAAARDGLLLCYNVIIPSLFPFFVLSSLLVELGLADYVGRALEPIMRPLFRVPGVCAGAVALGFVGGYPVGARTALRLYERGACTKTEAERLLSFCNNSGPAFILGVVGAGVFSDSRVGLLLYLVHAAASVAVGLLFRFYGGSSKSGGNSAPPPPRRTQKRAAAAFVGAVRDSFSGVLNICAFVVFFTVVIRLLFVSGVLPNFAATLGVLFSPLGFSPGLAEQLLTGVIELSSGVWSLTAGGGSGSLPMAAFMLGWAGLSVHCQVLGFVGGSGLSVRTYVVGKLLHGGLSALLTALLTRIFPLAEPTGAYLAEQVTTLAEMDFSRALPYSVAAAFVAGVAFLLPALWGKTRGRGTGDR